MNQVSTVNLAFPRSIYRRKQDMETRIYPMNLLPIENEFTEIALSLQQAVPGYGFCPTEEVLINYLKSEVPGWRGSFCIIPTLDNIYKINPWELPAKFNEKSIIPSNDQEWWFICPQTQSKRISRKTRCGSSWKISSDHKDVKAGKDSKKIGYKKILVFPSDAPTTWVIHEYHLLDSDVLNLSLFYLLQLVRFARCTNSIV
ncbi:NAC domain-containing protein 86-like isoform X1 [Rhodamnia argentea]|uniref:NAC domain-containing protein 86-like isoform X1 n=1 Tax=Rhodamnia argentea TaxID=178133 RepID=A0ABM3HE11_9MYRT|nr:NAC domain-containing protein 86-like isoform X1 [Rhodamnia argentea]